MATPDDLSLQTEALSETKRRKPPAEKPPDATDVALEQGNWNAIDTQMLERRQGGVVEVQDFGQEVADEPELGTLAADQAALTDREISDAQERAKSAIKELRQEAGTAAAPVAEAPPAAAPAPEKPPEAAVAPEAIKPMPAVQVGEAPSVPAEAAAQARLAEITQEMDGLRARIKGAPADAEALKRREQALRQEHQQVQAELRRLKDERSRQEEAALLGEAEADLTAMHAAAMAAPAGAEKPAAEAAKTPEQTERDKQEKMKGLRGQIGTVAREVRAANGAVTEDVRSRIRDMSGELFDLESVGQPPEGIADLRALNQELTQALFHSEDPQDRLKALNVLFKEHPDLAFKTAEHQEQRAEACRSMRADLGRLALMLRDNDGYFTDEMAAEFNAIKANAEAMHQVAETPDVEDLLEAVRSFSETLDPDKSPDAPDRLKKVRKFFKQNPDLDQAPAEAGEGPAPEAEKLGIPDQVPQPDAGDMESLLDVQAQAFGIGEGDFAQFFKQEGGARHKRAVADLDAGVAARNKKIEDLRKMPTASPEDTAFVSESIAGLEEANRLAELRKKQWETQRQLSMGLDALPLHDQAISELQDDLEEVDHMLDDRPNDTKLLSKRESLMGSLEFRGLESSRAYAAVDRMRGEIESYGRQIDDGLERLKTRREAVAQKQKAVSQKAEEKAKLDALNKANEVLPERISGTSMDAPEQMLERGIVGAAQTVIDIMGAPGGEAGAALVEKTSAGLKKAADFVLKPPAKAGSGGGGARTYGDRLGAGRDTGSAADWDDQEPAGAQDKARGQKEKKPGEAGKEGKEGLDKLVAKFGKLVRKIEKDDGKLTDQMRSDFQELSAKVGGLDDSAQAKTLKSQVEEVGRLFSLAVSDGEREEKVEDLLRRYPDLNKP